MKQEDELFKKIGTDNYFKVPDNYFDSVQEEIMSKLPEKEYDPSLYDSKSSIWLKVKPWVYMAAMFAGIALMFEVFNNLSGGQGKNEINIVEAQPGCDAGMEEDLNDYYNYMLENSMMDDYSMYQYLKD